MSAFCDTCQKSFYSKQTLQRHRLKAHADSAAQAGKGPTSEKEDEDNVEESDEEQSDDRETDNGDDGDVSASDQDSDVETSASDIVNVVKGAILAKSAIDTAAWEKCQKIAEKTLDYASDDE